MLKVDGGETLDLGGRQLQIYYTPGHAPHHIAILDSKTQGLFCGEALGHYYPELDLLSPAVALPFFDVDMAKKSIRDIRRLKPAMLLFSQRGVSKDVERLAYLAEEAIDAFSAVILEGFHHGASITALSQRLMDCHRRLTEARSGSDIVQWFRGRSKQHYTQMASAFLNYYAKRHAKE